MLTTLLDLLGVACLGVLAYLIWPPLVLAIAGLTLLAVSRARS